MSARGRGRAIRQHGRTAFFALVAAICWPGQGTEAQAGGAHRASPGDTGCALQFPRQAHGWGMALTGSGQADALTSVPLQIELQNNGDGGNGEAEQRSAPYTKLRRLPNGTEATGAVAGLGGSSIAFTDQWTCHVGEVTLQRSVRVIGTAPGGFATAFVVSHAGGQPRSQVQYFAPGVLYGTAEHLSPKSIGGADAEAGSGAVHVREDRLPAPVFGVRFPDGSSLSMLDSRPDGSTTAADAAGTIADTQVNAGVRVGALGVERAGQHYRQGFWFPGSEGEITYAGNTYPGGQIHGWRRRFHPVQDGLTQTYTLSFRLGRNESFAQYTRQTWRWAYRDLSPVITPMDIAATERDITAVLASQARTIDGRTGIPNFVSGVTGTASSPEEAARAVMGFTGKNLEAAELLLARSLTDTDAARAAEERRIGLGIFATFTRLKLDPPAGEGVDLRNGAPILAIPQDKRVYLRSFTDDLKATVRAYHRERLAGHPHPEWLSWAGSFATWLETQQYPDGGFPRSWQPGTGAIVDKSAQSTYNAIPLLVLLAAESTGPEKDGYLQSAVRAGEYSWKTGQAQLQFAGGTIDNPDILDKEAGTLSLEAYLALLDATHQAKWLDRARIAADYAETWVYLWNVPMPVDADPAMLQWKAGVPTVGVQLIATGHSLTDEYMAFSVGDFARLGKLTDDAHYLEVARLLLFDTKSMVANRTDSFGLHGPGWQQEHWSMAPRRGVGLHRGWLPWVATSQLQGILSLREYDEDVCRQWTKEK